ncbi:MAG TPA: DUF6152 family protein [Caulobacterales bacterium]|nr:DUF6152 family protein [Caulobacterales bacterium]
MNLNRGLLPIAAAFALLSLTAAPAFAHHGWGGNQEAEFELTGTVVKQVSLAGPHATMQIKDKNGQVWDITLAPPARTDRAGLKENSIPLGATVMVHGHRNSDMKRFEIKTERVTWEGKVFNVYPDRT